MKKKRGIIKLFLTKEEKEERAKKTNISDDSENIDDIEQPKKMLERIVNDNMEITNNNDITKTFTQDNVDVLVIKDKNGEYWYRGKDIATLLEYTNTRGALTRHVSEEYKKSFADMGDRFPIAKKIDPQTIFCSDAGFIELMIKSKKPKIAELWKKIKEEILPTLFKTGTYTMPVKKSDISQLTKSFYDDNMLSEFMGSPCVYFSYVGKHKIVINGITKEEHVIKYGETRNMDKRDLKQHRKFYKTFNMLGIWKTLANVEVESQIEANFQSLNMLVDLKIKGMNKKNEENKREHIILTEKHDLDYCLNMINNVVKNTSLPQENELKKEITNLKHKNELQLQKNNYLEDKVSHLQDQIKLLKENINDLRTKTKK